MKNIFTAGIILAFLFSNTLAFAQGATQPVNDYAILKINYRDFYFTVQYSMTGDSIYNLNKTLNFPNVNVMQEPLTPAIWNTYMLKCFNHLDKKGFEFVSPLSYSSNTLNEKEYLFRKKHQPGSK